jgi:tetratricopeptide (TPR) repeat protein
VSASRWRGAAGALLLVGLALGAASCATRTPPAVAGGAPAWRQPDVPSALAGRAADVAAYDAAWNRIRTGDVRGGERGLSDLLKRATGFYPAAASLGELRLQRQQFREAAALFGQALAVDATYLPALVGLVDARLGVGDDPGALDALHALLAVDPTRADAQSRVAVIGLRVSQAELAAAETSRAAGRLDEASARLLRALAATPENGAVLRALAAVALQQGAPDLAERRAREAVALDPQDAAALALLGDAQDAQGHVREAAASYARALAITPNPLWSERRSVLLARSDVLALPAGYQAIAGAASVTRAQVAAMLGVRLAGTLDQARVRSTDIVTDARGHWASAWILPVVRAGWMDARPNHTFEPAALVRRAELAQVVLAVLTEVATARRAPLDVTGATSRGAFADMARSHAAFRAAAMAVSAGIMDVDGSNRFQPAGLVSGRELIEVIGRLERRAK